MIPRHVAKDLWTALARAFDSALNAGPDVTETLQQIAAFHGNLGHAVAQEGGEPVRLRMRMSLFVHEHRALTDASNRGRSLITMLRRIEGGGFQFRADVSPKALQALLRIGVEVSQDGGALDAGVIHRRLAGLEEIGLLEPQDDVRWQFLTNPETTAAYVEAGFDVQVAEPLRQGMATAVEDAVTAAGAGEAVDLDVARTTREQVVSASQAGFDNLVQLAERPDFDVFTVQHSLRVSLFATYVSNSLGAPKDMLIEIGAAAMYHDVGKGRIPDEVFYKPGRLDADERRVMALHPELGASILATARASVRVRSARRGGITSASTARGTRRGVRGKSRRAPHR